mmetsp:Transcript_6622/g.15103  ORF Transcript_6622/g.15103 Transcript_6622/m.15103 type:complete len:131 (-) Transcript_6622:178-570(-)
MLMWCCQDESKNTAEVVDSISAVVDATSDEPGVEEARRLVGAWSVDGGSKFHLSVQGGILLYQETVDQRTLSGPLVYIGAGEWEADIKYDDDASAHGSLRIRCEGKGIRSHFRPAGDGRWCEKGLFSTRF